MISSFTRCSAFPSFSTKGHSRISLAAVRVCSAQRKISCIDSLSSLVRTIIYSTRKWNIENNVALTIAPRTPIRSQRCSVIANRIRCSHYLLLEIVINLFYTGLLILSFHMILQSKRQSVLCWAFVHIDRFSFTKDRLDALANCLIQNSFQFIATFFSRT